MRRRLFRVYCVNVVGARVLIDKVRSLSEAEALVRIQKRQDEYEVQQFGGVIDWTYVIEQ